MWASAFCPPGRLPSAKGRSFAAALMYLLWGQKSARLGDHRFLLLKCSAFMPSISSQTGFSLQVSQSKLT